MTYKIDFDDRDTIKNFFTYLDLTCALDSHKMIAMVGAITLMGCLVGSVVLLP